MPVKKVKVYYCNAVTDIKGEKKIINLESVIKLLSTMSSEERVLDLYEGSEKTNNLTYKGNIQLKNLTYNKGMWKMSFLKNGKESPFRTRLDDDKDEAESLDDDEFIGYECCCIYEEKSKIIAIQSNINSIGIGGLTAFFNKFINGTKVEMQVLIDKSDENRYEDEECNYKSIIVGFSDITRLKEIADSKDHDYELPKELMSLASSIGAITGKIELGVGRSKKFLSKENLSSLIRFFKVNKTKNSCLKLKILDADGIRTIDLISNKVYDELSITISSTDPKNFEKILRPMEIAFRDRLEGNLKLFADVIKA